MLKLSFIVVPFDFLGLPRHKYETIFLFSLSGLVKPDLIFLKLLKVRVAMAFVSHLMPNIRHFFWSLILLLLFALVLLYDLLHVKLVGLNVILKGMHHKVEINVGRVIGCLRCRFKKIVAGATSVVVLVVLAVLVV